MAIGSRWSGRLVERTGSRLPLVLGSALTAMGYAILGLSGNLSSYWTGFLPGLVVVGIGVTLCVAPLTTTVFNSSPQSQSGTASGINSAVDVAGGLVAGHVRRDRAHRPRRPQRADGQAEAAFRIQKDQLRVRPIWHQRADRVEAHILVCFLAFVLWKTLELWQQRAGLGNSSRTVLEELVRIQSHDVVLPTASHGEIRLRCVAQPE